VVFGTMVTAAAVIPSIATRLPFTPSRGCQLTLVGPAREPAAVCFLSLAGDGTSGTGLRHAGRPRREMMIGFFSAEPALLVVIFVVSLTVRQPRRCPLIAERLSGAVLHTQP